MRHKVGIIGHGFVGFAVDTGLSAIADVRIYDKFKTSESLDEVVLNSDIIFICTPTPMNVDGSCDTSIAEEVIYEIDKTTQHRKTIVIKSTVPPGTTRWLSNEYKNHTFVFNPEYLTEAKFLNDFLTQDRIVLGRTPPGNKEDEMGLSGLYEDFVRTQPKPAKIIWTDSDSAEMGKYIINTFLATKVTYFNEIKEICDATGVNFDKAVEVALLDTRIGNSHFKVPGPDGKHGFGGSCFTKDTNALIALAEELGLDPLLLQSVWTKNLVVREDYEWENLAQVTGEYKDEEV